MLRALDIRDMLIIDRLELEFQPGLNVLTGETGAGKSILLDSLGFVLGWRGRAELVRTGAAQGEVTAVFELAADHPARRVLSEAGIEADGELILRRVNTETGRKTAWVNDRRVSGEVLRALSDQLLELHGQHDDRGLLDPRGHRLMLDEFAQAAPAIAETRRAWAARRDARRSLAAVQRQVEALRAEEDYLRHAVAELDAMDPQPGEEAELDATRRRMQGAERIRGDVARAHQVISGEGAECLVSDAMRWLDGAIEAAEGRLDPVMEALTRALDALGEAETGVRDVLDALEFDPRALEAAEERLFALRGLARKHEVAVDELASFTDGLRRRLAALDASEGDMADLEAAMRAADAAYDAAAAALSELRRDAGLRLSAAMAAELAPPKPDRAAPSQPRASAPAS